MLVLLLQVVESCAGIISNSGGSEAAVEVGTAISLGVEVVVLSSFLSRSMGTGVLDLGAFRCCLFAFLVAGKSLVMSS